MIRYLSLIPLLFLAGCGKPPLDTVNVRGEIIYPGGSLAQGMVVLQSPKRDRTIRGIIGDDHTFTLVTILNNTKYEGVEPGTYVVEIVGPPSKEQITPLYSPKKSQLVIEAGDNQVKIAVEKLP